MAFIQKRKDRPVVMCFGDSNTNGICPMQHSDDCRRFKEHERWPGVMRDKFEDAVSVIEEGLPGRTTIYDDLLQGPLMSGRSALEALLRTHFPVNIVIIMLGTNDLKSRFSLSPLDIAMSVQHLVLEIQKSSWGPNQNAPQILLIAPPLLVEGGWASEVFVGAEEKSKKLPAHLEALANKLRVPFIKAGQHVLPDPTDNIHLSKESHKILGTVIGEEVGRMLNFPIAST